MSTDRCRGVRIRWLTGRARKCSPASRQSLHATATHAPVALRPGFFFGGERSTGVLRFRDPDLPARFALFARSLCVGFPIPCQQCKRSRRRRLQWIHHRPVQRVVHHMRWGSKALPAAFSRLYSIGAPGLPESGLRGPPGSLALTRSMLCARGRLCRSRAARHELCLPRLHCLADYSRESRVRSRSAIRGPA